MSTDRQLLQVNVKIMKFLRIWPKDDNDDSKIVNFFKDFLMPIQILIGTTGATTDLIIQMSGKYDDVMDITENITALGALYGTIYMTICFLQNRKTLQKLLLKLSSFEEFCSPDIMLKSDQKSRMLTKIFTAYGIIGNSMYMLAPYLDLKECKERRSCYKHGANMPCELITRIRIPFTYEHNWWSLQAVVVWELYVCMFATFLVLSISLFAVSLLMQVVAQLQELRSQIKKDLPVRDCIRYHIAIINFAKELSDAFSSSMLMYITITSFEISILGFETLMVNSPVTSFRYAMHLVGWVVLLFLICSFGQQLIDESIGIGQEVCASSWYEKSISEQKSLRMMIMRSQKPLIINAASFGHLSLETFLSVLSTAYSFFTLIINVKEN